MLILTPPNSTPIPTFLYSLTPLDIEVMKRLGSRVNLIPVIAKADTLTPINLDKFKQNVSN
jgi:cell division control protein 12